MMVMDFYLLTYIARLLFNVLPTFLSLPYQIPLYPCPYIPLERRLAMQNPDVVLFPPPAPSRLLPLEISSLPSLNHSAPSLRLR